MLGIEKENLNFCQRKRQYHNKGGQYLKTPNILRCTPYSIFFAIFQTTKIYHKKKQMHYKDSMELYCPSGHRFVQQEFKIFSIQESLFLVDQT